MPEPETNQPYTTHKPRLAMALSILFAGLGQLYNRRWGKGILFIILMVSFISVLGNFVGVGLWGIFTLGTLEGADHSIMLLIQGLMSLGIIVVFGIFYIANIVDAYREAEKIQEGFRIYTIKESFQNTYDKGFPYFLLAIPMVLMAFIVILPLVFMVLLAFTDYSLYNAPPANLLNWVGFENFVDLVTVDIWQETLFSVLTWTIVWTFVATTLQIALGLFLAVIINDPRIRFKRLIRTVFILPWAVPAFVTILIFAAMFNDGFGAINRDILIPFLGVEIPWQSDPFWTRTALIMIQTWLGFPFVFALFTGVLQSVSKDWYEAADVDGASRFAKFRKITLPHVLFATAPLLIMQYAMNFNNFNIIYLFNEGGPPVRGQNAGGSDILISWVYSLTFETQNYNMAAAISLIIGLIICTVAFWQFRQSRSYKEEGKVF
ncbi:arabinogalactan oligomer/maltooligosaccharide transport system permease protein [Geomicrobium halophilum]|uniref:Maltose/maltodextrin transport system permease protein n=1 Tax=Geomicrobium halophilum TaxID=549000 RepID=A0A841PZE8_9BACL|nr:sugar ABC transporter permease [Geomicrobium halophilum]MBB6450032.1 arabinogalactan oligomer/maltooligosaccharide transport system permease protein [Geomicrobium halophilum]